jgi:flagellar hook-length control protein FliK
MKKPAENSEEFLKLIREWQALEDATIKSANELISKTGNPLVKMTMEMIRHDSEKHKVMQQMMIDNITKEAVHLSHDELAPLSDLLLSHMETEAKSLALADTALQQSELFITRYILSYLIADEQKHHSLLGKLNELKRATAFVT